MRTWHCFDSSPGLADTVAGGSVDHDSTDANINILTVLGRNLRDARKSAGLTQAELAVRAGIARTVLAQIESGCHDPGLELLGVLAKAVGCAEYELVSF